ncbi:hypothetical protein B194_5159 [Serratia plymuthica A30]|nr:hypothetical protein B194_5159 [Serratia plymuthica A30]
MFIITSRTSGHRCFSASYDKWDMFSTSISSCLIAVIKEETFRWSSFRKQNIFQYKMYVTASPREQYPYK